MYDFYKMSIFGHLTGFNPISHELWNDVITQGGAIMARMDSGHPEVVSRHSRAQN